MIERSGHEAPEQFTLSGLPNSVRVVEVGPRDGLQNEVVTLSTQDKVTFIELLADAGLRDIEVASFVSPKRVPQLADAEALYTLLKPRDGIRYSALVPNLKGLERALQAGASAIALFTAASETFTQQNIGMSIAESLETFRTMMPLARQNNLWVRAYVSTAFVCPYEGAIPPHAVKDVVYSLLALGVDEVSVGDTIGKALPDDTARLTEALLPILPIARFVYHFHDTSGKAVENVEIALRYGICVFDSAAGGAGGCPFAPGAPGNLATEDLLSLLESKGIKTRVDRREIVRASRFLETRLGRPLRHAGTGESPSGH